MSTKAKSPKKSPPSKPTKAKVERDANTVAKSMVDRIAERTERKGH